MENEVDGGSAPAPMSSSGRRSRIRDVPRDVILVLLGAVLAFGGEALRDSRRRHTYAAAAVTSIRQELEINVAAVSRAQAHHRWLADTLGKLAAAHRVPDVSVYSNGMFNPAPVTSVAWETARQSGALSDLPLSWILAVAPAYEAQERYRSLGDAMGAAIMADVRHDGMDRVLRDRFEQFVPLDVDFANREGVLLEHFRRAIARTDSI